MQLEPGTRLTHYEILAPLGRGGMGEVFRAKDTKLGREVAIKVLPEEFTKDAERLGRFEREARLLAALDHPQIASIHGFEQDEDIRFLVMQLVEGMNLADRLRAGPLSVEESIGIAKQVAEALETAHEKGIIHRDLKPANIMVDDEGNAKVLDFGLARAFETEEGDEDYSNSPTMVRAATHAGIILGTAGYMSPEQARGKRVDRRADIWAFGVVFFEMLTGEKLFAGDTVSDTLASVLKEEVDWSELPENTPTHVRFLLKRCLTKDPRKRLQSIGEARILLSGEAELPEAGTGQVVPVPEQAGRRASLVPWLLAGLLLVALIAVFVMRSPGEPEIIMAELPTPDGTQLQFEPTRPAVPALSPDGSKIAFVAVDESGASSLYVRSLGQPSAIRLTGTDGAQYPFWSPDSRYIGFFTQADGTLKKIDSTGGPPVTVCAAQDGKGGSWGDQNVIVFTPGATDPLQRVSAAGGEPTAVTDLEGTKFNSHRLPSFLPGGTHFLFVARANNPDESEIQVGSVDGGEPVSLFRSVTQAQVANGKLLFVREQSLMVQPFDLEKRMVTGEAMPLAEKIAVIPGAALAIFSASSNGRIAYTTGEVETNTEVRLLDREGNVLSTSTDVDYYRHAAIAPNGSRAATTAFDVRKGTADIWIHDLDRNLRNRFTFADGTEDHPVWGPDGETIYYVASGESAQSGIYRKTVGGTGGAELLYESDTRMAPSSVSPDGQRILYTSLDGTPDLRVLSLDGEKESRVLRENEFIEAYPVFSPDGRWIAYFSNDSEAFHVYATPYPDLGRRWQVSSSPGGYPYWVDTPEGEEIIYVGIDGIVRTVEISTAGDSLEIGETTELFQTRAPEPGGPRYSVTRDGQRFLVIPETSTMTDASMKLILNWPQKLE